MATTTPTTTWLRRTVAVGALSAAAIGIGASPAMAQDQHSGGESPNVLTRDPGGPADPGGSAGTEVLGQQITRDGTLALTGSDMAGIAVLGAAAVAAGAGALTISKRRRLSA